MRLSFEAERINNAAIIVEMARLDYRLTHGAELKRLELPRECFEEFRLLVMHQRRCLRELMPFSTSPSEDVDLAIAQAIEIGETIVAPYDDEWRS